MFRNQRGGPLTRFGVRYRLKKHLAASAAVAPTLNDKRLHPHSLRHTTAVQLLKADVDFATISQWLGHASVNTTMRYARADIDLKRAALSQVFPEALAPAQGETRHRPARTSPDGYVLCRGSMVMWSRIGPCPAKRLLGTADST